MTHVDFETPAGDRAASFSAGTQSTAEPKGVETHITMEDLTQEGVRLRRYVNALKDIIDRVETQIRLTVEIGRGVSPAAFADALFLEKIFAHWEAQGHCEVIEILLWDLGLTDMKAVNE